MEPITELLSLFEESTGLRITLADLGGIPHGYGLHRNFFIKNRAFCRTVKESGRGLRYCMRCKNLTNKKAARGAFCGCCPFGVEEVVTPLYCRGQLAGILYLTNFTTDPAHSAEKLRKNAPRVGCAASPDLVNTLAQGHPLTFYQRLADYLRAAITDFLESLPPVADTVPHGVQNALLMIEQTYYQPLTLKAIAESCYVNPKYLGQQILRHTGESFTTLLNRRRIDRAKSLLARSELSILEIALRCGYENVTYFNRVFKAQTGVTPTAWRKK